jgi:threonine dehydratase
MAREATATETPVTRDAVLQAAETIRGRVHRTPAFTASTLGDVTLKAELFQKTGSFKVRGVLNKLSTLTAEERARGVIGISAGNHAQALAWGAAQEGVDCLVVMWTGASEAKIAATRGYGAAVDLDADGPTTAFERLHTLIEETGRTLVHPFDDPVVIAGAGTVGLEVLEDAPGVETVLVATGGGGLVSGVAAAIGGRARVIAVEPELSTAVHDGLAAGRSVPVRPASVADGLSAPFAGEVALATLRANGAESLLVGEDAIEDAFRWLYERAKLAVEPAAATALAPILTGQVEPRRVAVVVSGGNVSAGIASAILAAR